MSAWEAPWLVLLALAGFGMVAVLLVLVDYWRTHRKHRELVDPRRPFWERVRHGH
ncbi:hypothetical protein PTE30175_00730 [Pandoraea terrae]|uniref:Uncharacterized protein n=1 Tax=Pandoraea terrae TaxID=1537710 RepID=A0A5E4SGH2_9BURK|nr:hypothetical protein [Pandoraea terrae]VVD74223.1 hypothetical protein PTE30175_00730 [Pandoraea terrae]